MQRLRINELYKSIGEAVRRYRTEKDLTQEKLAADSRLTRTSIVHIEKGTQRVPIDRLYQIAAALGVSVLDLLPINKKGEQLDLLSKGRVNESQFSDIEKALGDKS